jgi:Asp-tRNA(Asn)/Glu-tRNA(Gln) amidotransferase A subunit family amidase
MQFGATGRPALTIPIGWLPAQEDPEVPLLVAMQIVSRLWGDNKVLKAGYEWEKAFYRKMVTPVGIEFMKGNKSKKAAALTSEA